MISEKEDYGRLKFRRQFLISQNACRELSHWQYEKFEKFQIYAHQDIELNIISKGNVKLALIGYIIDPYHPKHSNVEILNGISSKVRTIDDVSESLHALSGRFVLLASISHEIYVFHDPCGMRSVFYAQQKGKVCLGSQPFILDYVVSLEKGDDFEAFNNSLYKNNRIESWLPCNFSIYENVNQLVPNHYLRLNDLRQVRYWPTSQIQSKELEEVVESAGELLKNLIKAGNNRFDLALPLTAGCDSRILLASCRDIAEDLYFYTLQYRDLNAASPDILIPKKILDSLGFAHHLIDCNQEPDPLFEEVYFQNVSLAHADWCKIAYGIFMEYPQDKVCIKGSCSEICRCFRYPSGRHSPINDVEQLIDLERGWEELGFIREPLSLWLEEAQKLNKKYAVDILDLFYWEQRLGSWQAQSQLEWDITQEVFAPFNHRELLEIMLSVSPVYRSGASQNILYTHVIKNLLPDPKYRFGNNRENILYTEIIKNIWPEVLKEPINPHKEKDLTYYYKKITKRIGIPIQ